jgi:hypothetical protein
MGGKVTGYQFPVTGIGHRKLVTGNWQPLSRHSYFFPEICRQDFFLQQLARIFKTFVKNREICRKPLN